jgi:thioredoxin 1
MGVIKVNLESEFKSCLNNNDLVICDYTAQWCYPCKIMSPIFEQLSEKYNNNSIFIKVDIDELSSVADEQNIVSMPTFKIYIKGKEVNSVIGADKQKLIKICEKYF